MGAPLLSWKTGLRVLGHPVHPMVSDFPIALLGSSLLWDGLGFFRNEAPWWAISFWDIALGLAFSFLTAASGMIDYAHLASSTTPEKKPTVEKATSHMLVMISAVSLYGVSLVIRGGASP